MRRHELTDVQWRRIELLLPGNGEPGGPWADHRGVINGVLFRTRTGVLWPDLPERYGPWQTVYERHRRWPAGGTWGAVLQELQIEADAGNPDGALARRVSRQEWAVNIDSTSCRAHQHSAGAPRKPPADHPQKGAGRVGGRWARGVGALAGRTDQQGPSALRRPGPPAALTDLARTAG
ncbi:IS5 family transposase [Streptomyces pseudogriseolus]|uniref:IS5 family transposase n=1 Tax=Streptomyces pseudogriseolus TaxID=36817 RepID=UPI0034893E21